MAITSARDPAGVWTLQGKGHISLRKDLPCRLCRRSVCDKTPNCVEQISVREVVEAAEAILAQKS
ncbi:MAG: hypothetical protein MJ016_04635 [Victivallaceae bacterium]|nr:hypothetical protein [Victivallaceae bacterium]